MITRSHFQEILHFWYELMNQQSILPPPPTTHPSGGYLHVINSQNSKWHPPWQSVKLCTVARQSICYPGGRRIYHGGEIAMVTMIHSAPCGDPPLASHQYPPPPPPCMYNIHSYTHRCHNLIIHESAIWKSPPLMRIRQTYLEAHDEWTN